MRLNKIGEFIQLGSNCSDAERNRANKNWRCFTGPSLLTGPDGSWRVRTGGDWWWLVVRLHILVNNVGSTKACSLTTDGIESAFQVTLRSELHNAVQFFKCLIWFKIVQNQNVVFGHLWTSVDALRCRWIIWVTSSSQICCSLHFGQAAPHESWTWPVKKALTKRRDDLNAVYVNELQWIVEVDDSTTPHVTLKIPNDTCRTHSEWFGLSRCLEMSRDGLKPQQGTEFRVPVAIALPSCCSLILLISLHHLHLDLEDVKHVKHLSSRR